MRRSRRATLPLAALGALLGWALAYGPARADHHEKKEGAPYIGGTYQMNGVITDSGTGQKHPLSGRLIIDQQGAAYSSTFHLTGRLRTPQGRRKADVIGRGDGKLEGGKLSGSVETQIVMAEVSGAAAEMPFVPRKWGPRRQNTVSGVLNDDGSITITMTSAVLEDGSGGDAIELRGRREDTVEPGAAPVGSR